MAHEELINWLNDAYSMETGLIPILENHARDVRSDPEAYARIQQHATETRRHVAELQRLIHALGGQASTVRATLSALIGGVESLATAAFRDEVVKNTLMDYASEHFEIACYQALIEAAREEQLDDVARTCQEILADEESMAQWLSSRIPKVVRTALERPRGTRSETGSTTRRAAPH
jgi:ferritin-like metal-binding protein YciE